MESAGNGTRNQPWWLLSLKRLIVFSIAVSSIIAGVILFPLPIPLGIILIVFGLTLLVSVSTATALWVRRQRQRYPVLNKEFLWLEKHLPKSLREWLQKTDP